MMSPQDCPTRFRRMLQSARALGRLREFAITIRSLLIFYYATMTGAAFPLMVSTYRHEGEPLGATRRLFELFQDMPRIGPIFMLLVLTVFGVVPGLLLRDALQANHGHSPKKAMVVAAVVSGVWSAGLFSVFFRGP